jgi:hypothetical protein
MNLLIELEELAKDLEAPLIQYHKPDAYLDQIVEHDRRQWARAIRALIAKSSGSAEPRSGARARLDMVATLTGRGSRAVHVRMTTNRIG